MAGALRELVAVFGVKYDPSGAVRADKDIDKLAATAKRTGAEVTRMASAVIAQEYKVAAATDDVSRKKERAVLRELQLKAKAVRHVHGLAQQELRAAQATARATEQAARRKVAAEAKKERASRAAARAAEHAANREARAAEHAARRTSSAWSRVRDTLTGFGVFFGAREVIRGFGAVITAASDADETMNVLQESFKGSTQEVLDFARVTADEVGRSQYQLREFAGTIGAIVNPMLAGMGAESSKVAAQVSTDFAKLAVDLSSFFNTTEEDALVALRAGLVGESEPLRRFGVNIVETNLADFAGMKPAQLQKLSQTEKTLLRYRFIMQQTAAAQGDAARTSEFFANKSRALLGMVKDIAVQLGRKMMPAVLAVTKGLFNFAKAAATTIRTSRIVEAAFITGAAAAIVFGTRAAWAGRQALWAFVKAAIPVLLMIAILVATALAVDDVLVAFEGGNSVFGDWLDSITGVSDSALLLKTYMENLGSAIYDLFHGGGASLDAFVIAWRSGFADILASAADWLEKMKPILRALSIVVPGAAPAVEFAPDALRAAADALRPENAGTTARANGRYFGASLANPGTEAITGRQLDTRGRGLAAQSEGGVVLTGRAAARADLERRKQELMSRFPGLAASPVGIGPRAPAPSVTNNSASSSKTEVNVNFNGPVDRANARGVSREVERGVRQALREERRKVATGVGN